MDYCWHCPICDVTLAMDEMGADALAELKSRATTGEAEFFHEVGVGEPHPLVLVAVRH
jgi:hypothetical protein